MVRRPCPGVIDVARGGSEGDTAPEVGTDLEALFRAKADAELGRGAAGLAGGAFAPSGEPAASTLFLKGRPGPTDVAQGRALAGPDAEAATASLDALGLPEGWLALVTRAPDGPAADPDALSRVVEAVDPERVVVLDAAAAEDAAKVLGMDRLPFGRPVTRQGRVWLAVDGLEQSLTDPALKRRVWAQLRTLGDL
jgi:hypothetical protein